MFCNGKCFRYIEILFYLQILCPSQVQTKFIWDLQQQVDPTFRRQMWQNVVGLSVASITLLKASQINKGISLSTFSFQISIIIIIKSHISHKKYLTNLKPKRGLGIIISVNLCKFNITNLQRQEMTDQKEHHVLVKLGSFPLAIGLFVSGKSSESKAPCLDFGWDCTPRKECREPILPEDQFECKGEGLVCCQGYWRGPQKMYY